MASYILSDPNMSDGTRPEVIEAIMDQLRGREGVKLIGYEPDPDFDRLPAEVLGRPEAMKEALLDMAGKAYELIDMERQHGRHPRVGAVDTIEVYPAKNITIEEAKDFAEDLGEELYKRYDVPIYFTGKNARRPENEGLTFIRKGNYEGLKQAVLVDPLRAPDLGPAKLHPTAGATIVGAVEEHDAYFNVVLDTDDLEIARKCANAVRGTTGGFTNIQGTIGLPQTHRRHGQEGRRGVHRDQQPAADATPPRLQPGQGRSRPVRRERHRRADLRHDRGRGARAMRRVVPAARGDQRPLGLQEPDPREPHPRPHVRRRDRGLRPT